MPRTPASLTNPPRPVREVTPSFCSPSRPNTLRRPRAPHIRPPAVCGACSHRLLARLYKRGHASSAPWHSAPHSAAAIQECAVPASRESAPYSAAPHARAGDHRLYAPHRATGGGGTGAGAPPPAVRDGESTWAASASASGVGRRRPGRKRCSERPGMRGRPSARAADHPSACTPGGAQGPRKSGA